MCTRGEDVERPGRDIFATKYVKKMISPRLVVLLCVESLVLLAMGALLLTLSDTYPVLPTVIGVVLIVSAVVVAALPVFPGVLRAVLRTARVCEA